MTRKSGASASVRTRVPNVHEVERRSARHMLEPLLAMARCYSVAAITLVVALGFSTIARAQIQLWKESGTYGSVVIGNEVPPVFRLPTGRSYAACSC